jgi:uncharacterized protein YdhG (YjbR/CyaY superfamily)
VMKNNEEVEKYILAQPVERQEALRSLRETIQTNLPQGFEERMQYGMIGYVVPFETYPSGYHVNPKEPLPFLALANQKQYIALYHMGIYGDPALLDWFQKAYESLGIGKLDMGKSCIRFKKIDQIPLDLVAALCQKITPAQYVEQYEASRNKLSK